MNELQQRIANSLATNDDYIAVLGSLGYEVREHQRMFRRLCKRKFGSTGSFTGVPSLTSADDADLHLRHLLLSFHGRFMNVEYFDGEWSVEWATLSHVHTATARRLGCAMWAAYAGVVE